MSKSTVYLGKVSKITMGQSPSSSSYSEEKKGLPFLQGCAEFGDKHPTPVKYCSVPLKVAPKGSVLVSVRAPVGDINIADQDYIIGRGLAAISATNINQHLLPYLLDFVKPQLTRVAQGSTFEAISFDDLDRCQLPDLGDEKEQSEIAEVLSTIDRAIAQTEALIAKYQRIKTGLMQDLLTRGIDEHGQLRDPSTHKFNPTPLGMIPEEWECELFGKRAFVRGGKRLPKGHKYLDIRTGYRYLHTTDFIGKNIDYSNLTSLEQKTFEILENYEIHKGDLFISIAGVNLGVAGIYSPPSGFNDRTILTENAAKIVLRDNTLSEFVILQINSEKVQRQISIEKGVGGGVPKLALFRIENLFLAFPSREEQEQIVNILESASKNIRAYEQSLQKLKDLKRGLMQDLLSGRVSVKPLMDQ